MSTIHLVNLEEYLHSTFEPDAEYVEGRIVRRSVQSYRRMTPH